MVSGYISFRSFCKVRFLFLSSRLATALIPLSLSSCFSALSLLVQGDGEGRGLEAGRGRGALWGGVGAVAGVGGAGTTGSGLTATARPASGTWSFPARAPCAASRCSQAASDSGGEYLLTPAVCAPRLPRSLLLASGLRPVAPSAWGGRGSRRLPGSRRTVRAAGGGGRFVE